MKRNIQFAQKRHGSQTAALVMSRDDLTVSVYGKTGQKRTDINHTLIDLVLVPGYLAEEIFNLESFPDCRCSSAFHEFCESVWELAREEDRWFDFDAFDD